MPPKRKNSGQWSINTIKKKTRTVKPNLSLRAGTGTATYAKFIYSQEVSINPGGAGVTGNQQFRLSSIHDPDFTGVGHQPVNYDQYAAVFERYQVYKVDICFIQNRSDSASAIGGIFVSDRSATSADPRVYIENGFCKWALLPTSDTHTHTYKTSIDLSQVHGVTQKQYMANDDYGANFGSNPAEEAYLTCFAAGISGGDPGGLNGWIEITYHVKMMGTQVNSLS